MSPNTSAHLTVSEMRRLGKKEMATFSEALRREADPIWKRIFVHPFLVEILEGTLPLEKFRYYLRQDHAYLFEYCRFFGLAASRCETIEQVSLFSEILSSEFNFEIQMQREVAKRVGLSPEELEHTKMAPTAKAYTSYLMKVAATEGIGEIVAAMAPCPLTYMEIGRRNTPQGNAGMRAYSDWLAAYRSKEAVEMALKIKQMLDKLGDESNTAQRERMTQNFLDASRYEYLFWDMAYKMEEWPI